MPIEILRVGAPTDAGIGNQEVRFPREWTKGMECMSAGEMHCEYCWPRTILAYVRERKRSRALRCAIPTFLLATPQTYIKRKHAENAVYTNKLRRRI